MRTITTWASALILGGFAASALALPQAEVFEQCESFDGPQVSIDGYTQPAAKSVDDIDQEMRQLHAWLSRSAAPLAKSAGIEVALSRSDRAQIGEASLDGLELQADPRRLQVGVAKSVDLELDFAALARGKKLPAALARGALQPSVDGGFVWTTKLRSDGAHGLRVVFRDMDLPPEAELYVYSKHGEAFGPYYGRGANDSGEQYSHTITGDEAMVQLHVYGVLSAKSLRALKFRIAEVGHIGSRFELARWMNPELNEQAKAFCSYNASCVTNGECASGWSALGNVRQAVAHMLFPSGGGYYICSGGLINNTANNGRPLFLTANHCLSSATSANGLETFFDYRASSCTNSSACDLSYTQMRQQFPRVVGSTILATNKSGDYTLLELSAVPAGTRHFLGFSTAAVANSANVDLYRMSHPKGAPQAYSRQRVNTTAGTCRTLARGTYIYSTDIAGATEGGSSGSPVMNVNGQVVGQLYGACGTNTGNVCDSNANRTVDGALAAYYSGVASFLDPAGGGGGEPGDVTASATVLSVQVVAVAGPNKEARATVRVRDQNNNPVAGAGVSGNFSGATSGSRSGSTGSNGEVVISSPRFKTAGSVSFCVTGVSGDGITWNGTSSCNSGS
jgi:lysyl endopeptidase